MQSAKSYFNKTLFFFDLKRGWPVWVSYLVFHLFVIPLPPLSNQQYYASDATRMARHISSLCGTEAMVCFVFAAFAAMVLFGYLCNARGANGLHALPLRREGHFITHYLAGLSYFVIPNLIVLLTTLPVMFFSGATYLETIFVWFAFTTLFMLFFFSLAVFCAQFTGHIVAMPVFYLIWNFLIAAVTFLVNALAQSMLYGYAGSDLVDIIAAYGTPLYKLSDIGYYLSNYASVSYWVQDLLLAAVYAAIGLILTALALLVYRRRPLEAAGDVVAIGGAKPLFRFGVAFVGGLGLGMLTCAILNWYSEVILWLCTMLWSVVCYLIAEMLLHKSFRVLKKGLKSSVVYVAAVTLIYMTFSFDLLGFETRVPSATRVEQVQVRMNTAPSDGFDYTLHFEQPLEVEAVIDLHKALLTTEDAMERLWQNSEDYDSHYLQLTYLLADGSTVSRNYPFNEGTGIGLSEMSALFAIINQPQYLFEVYFDPGVQREDIILGGVSLYLDRTQHEQDLPTAQARILYDAVYQDLYAGRLGTRTLAYGRGYNEVYGGDLNVSLRYYIYTYDNDTNIPTRVERYADISIPSTATETLKALQAIAPELQAYRVQP